MLHKERRKVIVPFLAPAVILYLVFFIYPALRGLYLSLFDWSGFTLPAQYIGLKNFQQLVHDVGYLTSLKNTLALLFIGGAFVFGLAFLFTYILSSGLRGKKFFRAVIFLPNVVAPIALTTLWGFIYNPRFGLINSGLRAVGLSQWTRLWTEPDKLFGAIMVALIWIYTGFYLVLLLAGADKIPQELYDAARVDGTSPFQMFTRLTVPLLWDVIDIGVVLWMITALKQFEFIYAFSGPGYLRPETWTLAIYLQIMGFGKRDPIFRLGYASAIGATLVGLVIVFAILGGWLMRRETVQY